MSSPDLHTLFAADDELDEVMRARIWARLSPVLTPAVPLRRPGRWLAIGAGAVVVAAAAVAFVVLRHREVPAQQLVAPSSGVLTVPLGPHTNATIVGPARLTVNEVGDQTSVELESGGFVAEFTGGAGRALHVRARGVSIEIVGTVFSVAAEPHEVCLAVAHGRVKIASQGVTRFVGAGEQSCAPDDQAPGPVRAIEPPMQDLLAHRAATRLAAVTPAPPMDTTLPPPTVNAMLPPPAVSPPTVNAMLPPPAVSPPPSMATPLPVSPPRSQPASARQSATVEANDTRLYDSAEQAMARGDGSAADRDLAKLVTDTPSSQLLDEALYDRARLAFDRHDWATARAALDELSSRPTSPLREPGMYLRCRIDLASDPTNAAGCFTAYRSAFPRGPHDLDAGLQLVAFAFKDGGCDATRALIDELATAYPGTRSVEAWQDRCRR